MALVSEIKVWDEKSDAKTLQEESDRLVNQMKSQEKEVSESGEKPMPMMMLQNSEVKDYRLKR